MNEAMRVGILTGGGVLVFCVGLLAHIFHTHWQARLHRVVGRYADDDMLGIPKQVAVAKPSSSLAEKLNARLRKLSFMPKLRTQLITAGVNMAPSRFLVLRVVLALIGALVGFIFLSAQYPAFRLAGMILGGTVAYHSVRPVLAFKRQRRIKALENQLPDAIDVLAGALEAGSSLPQAMVMASREMDYPISTEFTRVARDQELGLNQQEALERMLARCPSEDLDMMITAINIQYRVGGNLAHVLRAMSHTVRERLRIRGEIKTLTAQGRMSAYIITALPFALMGALFFLNREYITPLFTTRAGNGMLVAAFVLVAMGNYVMRRMITIKV